MRETAGEEKQEQNCTKKERQRNQRAVLVEKKKGKKKDLSLLCDADRGGGDCDAAYDKYFRINSSSALGSSCFSFLLFSCNILPNTKKEDKKT